MNPADPRLEALQRYVDGLAAREDVDAIERAIVGDAEFRALAVEYLHLDSAMEEFAGEAVVVPWPTPQRTLWALAAAVAILVGLSLWWMEKPSAGGVSVEIVQLAGARFAAPHAGLHKRDQVKLDGLDLLSGEAHLRLPSGVNLVASGPVNLQFIDAMHARVLHGKVTVDAGAHGKGFILDAPEARVVDLGTRFGVDAKPDGGTDVMVLQGRIELFGPQGGRRTAALEQGEAVRVNAGQPVTRIVNITGSAQSSDWSTQPPPRDCNIASVSDNFGAAEGFHFYRIVPRGLRPGAAVYTNRPHVWKAADGQDFPASLANADVVQTFHGELRRDVYAIEIVVARPVDLFVIMPQRGIPPAWLTENFTRTGEELLLDEIESPLRSHLPFEVWKRPVPQAGKVTLGPGNRDANGRPVGMYGIAAKAL